MVRDGLLEDPVDDGRRGSERALDPGPVAREDLAAEVDRQSWVGLYGEVDDLVGVVASAPEVPGALPGVGPPMLEGRADWQGRNVRARMRGGEPAPQRLQEARGGTCSPTPPVGPGDDRLGAPVVGEGGEDRGRSIGRLVEVE